MSFTWPDGNDGATPKTYTLPGIGDFGWFDTINSFLTALGDGAQATTFQKYAAVNAVADPYTVLSSQCVVYRTTTGVVLLPVGVEKQVLYICNNSHSSITTTITPNGSETIGSYYNAGGGNPATLDLIGAYASVSIIFNNGDWVIFNWSQQTPVP